jgi:hypothetical protein
LSFVKHQHQAAFDRQLGAFTGELQVTEEKIYRTLFGDLPFASGDSQEIAELSVLKLEKRSEPIVMLVTRISSEVILFTML